MDKQINDTELGQAAKELADKRLKDDKYHDIARRLRDKQGFLFSAREFIKDQPLYYDKNHIWWLWNHDLSRWEISDDTEILNIVTLSLRTYGIGDASVKHKTNMLEALRQEGRLTKPKPFPKHWIQFRDQIFDLESKQSFPSSPEWFSINPIPWTIGTDADTPEISRLFDQWVGPEYTETLFQIVAYCCYTGYPIHRLFCLNGSGRNGKSTFQTLISRFIGHDNVCSVELDELTEKSNRFSSFALYKKLCCLMGETNFNLITNSNMLKKLTGGDLIKFEMKGAQPFSDYNYAKILISTNNLPPSADQSDGYYSRWVIIDFPNQFPEAIDVLAGVPEYEYRNLAKKITIILPQLLQQHAFSNQGDIEQRRQRYINRSNPLLHFIEEFYVQDPDANELYSTVFTHYAHWLKANNRRIPSQKVFSQMLSAEGYEIKNTSVKNRETNFYEKAVYVLGIRRKEKIEDFENEPADMPKKSLNAFKPVMEEVGSVGSEIPTQPYYMEPSLDSDSNSSIASTASISSSAPREISTADGTLALLKHILEYLNSFQNELCKFDRLLNHCRQKFNIQETTLRACLDQLMSQGNVYEPVSDFYGIPMR